MPAGVPPGPPMLPAWAEFGAWRGPGGAGPAVFCRDMLRLPDLPDGADWPPVSVLVYGEDDAAPSVLLEVSAAGTPELLAPGRARRLAAALVEAADLVEHESRTRAGPARPGAEAPSREEQTCR